MRSMTADTPMGPLPTTSIRRVAIVGAGPGGVAAAKYLRAENHFERIDVFEQQGSFGGVWNYTPADEQPRIEVPQTNPNPPDRSMGRKVDPINGIGHQRATFVNPMYDRLETNIPHVLMQHPDAPSFTEHQLFPTRETVIEYLADFAEDIRDLVQFETQVMDIQLKQESLHDVWIIEMKRLASEKISKQEYDAVVVANGHYSVPALPDIEGIRQWDKANPGAITHSKLYRNPSNYTNKKVIIVGNSASGTDIANQIGNLARHPVLNSTRSDSPLSISADWKKIVPEIAEFLPPSSGDRAVRFKDGSIETEIDAILFCTGYYYSLPFLSSLRPELIDTGERVQHLYHHLFYINHPSLAFIGLPSKIVPFRTFEGQAVVIARTWADRLTLPLEQEMNRWEQHEIAERGQGRAFHVLPFPKDFEYHNAMVDWASKATDSGYGKMPPKWSEKETWIRERFPLIKKAFGEHGEARHNVKTAEELGFGYEKESEEGNNKQDVC